MVHTLLPGNFPCAPQHACVASLSEQWPLSASEATGTSPSTLVVTSASRIIRYVRQAFIRYRPAGRDIGGDAVRLRRRAALPQARSPDQRRLRADAPPGDDCVGAGPRRRGPAFRRGPGYLVRMVAAVSVSGAGFAH